MAEQKTIVLTSVTIHRPSATFAPRWQLIGSIAVQIGDACIEAIEPGQPVTMDADEADDLIRRFGAKVVAEMPYIRCICRS